MKIKDYLDEAGFKKFPPGWTKKSVEKFAKTLTGQDADEKGFFDKCVAKLTKEFGEDGAKGYCAAIKDEVYGSTYWRGKDKSKEKTKKDVEKHQNV